MSCSKYEYNSSEDFKCLNSNPTRNLFMEERNCIFPGCQWKGFISQLPLHFTIKHEEFLLRTPSEISKSEEGTFIFLAIQDEVLFKIALVIYCKQASLTIEHLGYEVWNGNISYEVVLHNGLEKYEGNLLKNSTIEFANKCHTYLITLDIKVDDDMKMVYNKIKENCICGLCKCFLTPPMYVRLSDSKLLCADCTGYYIYFCEDADDEFRRLVLLEDEVMRFPIACRHCKVYASSPADIRWHEIDCKMRKIKCILCQWEDLNSKYAAHIMDSHSILVITDPEFEFEDKPFNAVLFRSGVLISITTNYNDEKNKKITIEFYGPPQFHRRFHFRLLNKINGDWLPQPKPIYTLISVYYEYKISIKLSRIGFRLVRI